MRDFFDALHRTIPDDGDAFGVVEGIGDEGFKFGKAGRVVISDKLMNKDDLVINGCREGVGLGQKVVFWIVLYGAIEGVLLIWW